MPYSAILIVMHEQGFGVMIPFCDLVINFNKNIIKQTIFHMIKVATHATVAVLVRLFVTFLYRMQKEPL